MHVRIVVDFVKRSLQSLLRRELVKGDGTHGDAEGVGALASGALVGQVVGTRPHAHDRKRRLDADTRKRVDARREICRQALDDGLSGEKGGHEEIRSFAKGRARSGRRAGAAR